MLTATDVLDRYFLDTRCMLLEMAATLDRYDRAVVRANPQDDPRLDAIRRSLEILAQRGGVPDRAERLLRLFSDPAE